MLNPITPLTAAAQMVQRFGMRGPTEAMQRAAECRETGKYGAERFWMAAVAEAIDILVAADAYRPSSRV